MEFNYDGIAIKEDFVKVLKFTPKFILRPVENMRNLPQFNPVSVLIFQLVASALSGLVMGLVSQKILYIIASPFVMLIFGGVTITLVGLTLYYFFYLFRATQLAYLELFKVLVFANLPFLIFHTLSIVFPPVDLIGLGLTSLLLIVGLSDHMQLPRKECAKLVLTLYALLLIGLLVT
jgi:hypothetical protein